jgi:PAS domain S-box-containing protein
MTSDSTPNELQRPNAHVAPDFVIELDVDRKCVAASDGFCKVLGYRRQDLVGKKLDDITVPRTNDIAVVCDLFQQSRYMHGIWVFRNRSKTAKIFMRYEARLREDSHVECNLELIGAGA